MSVEDMSDEMGLGTDCGSCLEQACKIAAASLKQSVSRRSAQNFAPEMRPNESPG